MSGSRASGLREFIENYRAKYPEDFLEVEEEISVEFDTTTYSVLRNTQNRMIHFKHLQNYGNYTLLTNMLGSERRVLFATGAKDLSEFNRLFSGVLNSDSREPVTEIKTKAPYMKNVFTGKSVDLTTLPIPSHYPLDGSRTGKSRYITSGLVAVREFDDPETTNLSFTRIQPISSNSYAFDAGSHGHLWNHLRNAVETDQEAELTILMGSHPLFYLLAASFVDNEYEKASSLMEVEFSKGLTNDIQIPSETEIVIEAKFLPGESYEEGPFAEYTGYMGHDSTRYVAEVKSIMMRDNPIYYDIQPSNSSEHVNIFSLPRSSRINSVIRQFIPQGTDFTVHWPHSGARFLSTGWVEPASRNLANQLGISIMSLDPLWGKINFINLGRGRLDLLSAIARLLNTKENIGDCVSIFRDMFVISSDFTAAPEGNSAKVLVITNSRDSSYSVEESDDELLIHGIYGSAVITHRERNDHRVNITVGSDIDINNMDKVLWAIATRVNPASDLVITDDRMVISANRTTPEVPFLDSESVKRIAEKFPE